MQHDFSLTKTDLYHVGCTDQGPRHQPYTFRVCSRCGASQPAVQHFGWSCREPSDPNVAIAKTFSHLTNRQLLTEVVQRLVAYGERGAGNAQLVEPMVSKLQGQLGFIGELETRAAALRERARARGDW